MSRIIPLTTEAIENPYDELRALVGDEMRHVSQLITEKMSSQERSIPDVGEHITKAGGKRLRPMLTLASAHLCGYQGRNHIALAASVELMHTATLLHDDVVDESDMRRGMETSRLNWGNATSVLVGDFMLGQAFKLMVSTGNLDVLDVLSNAAAVIAEGEVMQLASMNQISTDESHYLQVIEAKTAALFASALEVGGVIADQDKTTREALSTYGRNLGIAFQLVDDALDYSDANQTGKNTGDDFREGKVTLPVSLAYQQGTEKEKIFWERTIGAGERHDGDLEHAVSIMEKHNTLARTLERARNYGQKAKNVLMIFPDNPHRQSMLNIIEFCIRRTY